MTNQKQTVKFGDICREVKLSSKDPARELVIPAGMPKSSAMDGNLTASQVFNQAKVQAGSFTSF